MRKPVIAIAVLILLVATAAVAAQDEAKPQWWPGEGPAQGPSVQGKVTAVGPTSITVATPRGPATFAVTQETRVMVRGQRATMGDVRVDDHAVVRFAVAQDASRWARGIVVPKPQLTGKITTISGSTFTLTGRERAWNVTLAPNGLIVSHGYRGTLADLRIGYMAAVQGDIQGDSVAASEVHFRPPVIRGVVDQVNGNSIVVKTIRQQMMTATASDATVVLVRPRTAPNQRGTLADVTPGVAIDIGGHITGEGTMDALWIDLLVADLQNAPAAGPRAGARKR